MQNIPPKLQQKHRQTNCLKVSTQKYGWDAAGESRLLVEELRVNQSTGRPAADVFWDAAGKLEAL